MNVGMLLELAAQGMPDRIAAGSGIRLGGAHDECGIGLAG